MPEPDRSFLKELRSMDKRLSTKFNGDHFVVCYDRGYGEPVNIYRVKGDNGEFRQPDKRDLAIIKGGDLAEGPSMESRLNKLAYASENMRREARRKAKETIRDLTKDDRRQFRKSLLTENEHGQGKLHVQKGNAEVEKSSGDYMTDYTQFRKHLEGLRKNVYIEPKLKYHEKIIDSSFSHFVNNGSFTDVLDVGFGTGYSLDKFKELGLKVIGITLDDEERRAAHFTGHEVKLMDMAFLDFEDKSFDLVWCRHALEHSIMPMIALLEFNRVLRDGGHLYVEVPSDNVVHIENPNHYSLLSDGAWQSLFRKTGFHLLFRGQTAIKITGDERSMGYVDIYPQYWLKKI